MQTKLTLRLDDRLIRRAKSYAKQQGKSLSVVVADMFRLLAATEAPTEDLPLTPRVAALQGALAHGRRIKEEDYRRYLEKKHR